MSSRIFIISIPEHLFLRGWESFVVLSNFIQWNNTIVVVEHWFVLEVYEHFCYSANHAIASAICE